MKFDIISKRFWFFTISGVVLLIGIISLITAGLPSGIEFSSGSLLTVSFQQDVDHDEFKDMGGAALRKFAKANHVLYDIKYIFPGKLDKRLHEWIGILMQV